MRETEILEQALEDFKEAETAGADNRNTALKCIKFVDGDQWDDSIRKEREQDNRPCLTLNKLRKFVKEVSGNIRQNKISPKVRPVDDNADVEGAKVRNELIRHIEQNSLADDAYDNAVEQALDGGFGYWRIITEYAEDGFEQDIKIKRIPNRFTVYLDCSSQEYTYEDGRYAFISNVMKEREFKTKYKSKIPADWSIQSVGEGKEGWFLDNKVRLVEYFWKEPTTKEIAQLSDGSIIDFNEKIEQAIEGTGLEIIKRRYVKTHKVMWAKLSGDKILEGPNEIPSKYIPIVPIYGHEVNIEGKRYYRGLIYDALDAMRMYNYWRTHATEIVALAPKAPFLITPEQIQGHDAMWLDANKKNYPYLLYNQIPGLAKPTREGQTQIPTAVVNESNFANLDIKDTIGMYEASLGQVSNERSGRAILARQSRSDTITYTFIDNFAKSIAYTSKILLDMMPKVFDTERVLRLLGEDGKELMLPLNKTIKDATTGENIIINDLSQGKYDLVPTSGPKYLTRRLEAAASMLDFLQIVPMAAPVIAPRLAKMMDWPEAVEIAQELNKLFGATKEQETTPEEKEEIGGSSSPPMQGSERTSEYIE